MPKIHLFHQKILISIILISSTLAIYWQVSGFEFVGYDDSTYIDLAAKELSLNTLIWSFTTLDFANWHPLTWLSLILDYNLYGSNAGGYHVTNLLFHLLNTLLLFFLLSRMTGTLYRSAFVAALFALHPLHVESVAWVSERKDVLSTMFWLLTIWSYVVYTQKQKILSYIPVIIFFSLGLMAKPMLVTLPFVLLMMDYWPLNRIYLEQSCSTKKSNPGQRSLSFLILEKMPLFALSIASSIITYIAQHNYNAVASFEHVPLTHRVFNAFNSYAGYLEKTFWFQNLGVFYSYPKDFNYFDICSSIILITSITVLTLALSRKAPAVSFGWFWYLGTLVPVIGFVQVGSQAMADRYTYIPLIGIFIVISWGSIHFLEKMKIGKILFLLIAFSFLFTASFATYHQVSIWKNSIALFEHAVNLNWKNYQACNLLGVATERLGDDDKALYYYKMALSINPKYDPAFINAGNIMHKIGRLNDAEHCYIKALQINPKAVEAEYNLGIVFIKRRLFKEAADHLTKAIGMKPDDSDAHNNLGIALMKMGDIKNAYAHFQEAQRLNPQSTEVKTNIAIAIREMDNKNVPPQE